MEHTVHFQPGSMALVHLSEAASRADAEGKVFHVNVEHYREGIALKFKVGEGMWSPMHWSQTDEIRCNHRCKPGNPMLPQNHWLDCTIWHSAGVPPNALNPDYNPDAVEPPMFVVEGMTTYNAATDSLGD